jgi:hypothetical protein
VAARLRCRARALVWPLAEPACKRPGMVSGRRLTFTNASPRRTVLGVGGERRGTDIARPSPVCSGSAVVPRWGIGFDAHKQTAARANSSLRNAAAGVVPCIFSGRPGVPITAQGSARRNSARVVQLVTRPRLLPCSATCQIVQDALRGFWGNNLAKIYCDSFACLHMRGSTKPAPRDRWLSGGIANRGPVVRFQGPSM